MNLKPSTYFVYLFVGVWVNSAFAEICNLIISCCIFQAVSAKERLRMILIGQQRWPMSVEMGAASQWETCHQTGASSSPSATFCESQPTDMKYTDCSHWRGHFCVIESFTVSLPLSVLAQCPLRCVFQWYNFRTFWKRILYLTILFIDNSCWRITARNGMESVVKWIPKNSQKLIQVTYFHLNYLFLNSFLRILWYLPSTVTA